MKIGTGAQNCASVLIVDDTPANLQILAGLLGREGYHVCPVANGKLALNAAEKAPPDLILLDINMPEMNGYEVCRRLKADSRLRDIPVIFITARTDLKDKVEGFALGGLDYITKPFEFEEVLMRVRTHLRLYRLQREMAQAREAAERASIAKDRFIAEMSHEFRTPLNVILGITDLLSDQGFGPLNKKQAAYVNQIQQSGSHLLELVNDILDIAKIDAGTMEVEWEEFAPDECVAKVAALMDLQASKKLQTLEVKSDPAVTSMAGDLGKCRQIVFNLLSNAIKFTPDEGRILVFVEPFESAFVKVGVRDTGPGIPLDLQAQLFSEFLQVSPIPEERTGGAGLGLALSKRLVELHGGTVGCESTPRKGSTFWFTLPAHVPAQAQRSVD